MATTAITAQPQDEPERVEPRKLELKKEKSPKSILTQARPYALASLALLVLSLHLAFSLFHPQTAWITPTGWIAMYAIALTLTLRQARHTAPAERWRWYVLAYNFTLSILSFLCILHDELLPHHGTVAAWLSDLLRAYKGLALLLLVCTPEEAENRVNRTLDILQATLIALVFLILFTPSLVAGFTGDLTLPDPELVNRYAYAQIVIVALLAILATFTAKTTDARLFHRVLALYLWIGVPIGIWTNQVLINTWDVPPASSLFVFGDLCLLAFTIAVPAFRRHTRPKEPSHPLLFLRLAAAAFLPLFAILASMLLAIAGHHPILGVLAGLFSLIVFGLRSAHGQFQLLSVQWNLQKANQRLETLSQRDPLTGLYNRRWFAERLAMEWQRHERANQPLSLLLLDVDNFKLFNDTRGHAEGDLCLQTVSRTLQSTLRRNFDALVRYGGEEFIALLPNTDPEGASRVAHNMAEALATMHISHPASPFGHVTVSIGGATHHATDTEMTPESMLAAADAALYHAKEAGRNRIHFAPAPDAVAQP